MENSEKHQKIQAIQIAQIAQSISRAQGTFPGKPDINPVEHCNRIELRSGRTLGDTQIITQKEPDSEKGPSPLMPNQTQNRDGEEKDEEFNRFLKKIKEICVEVSLIDALHQMSKFAKFLKGILSNKRQKGDFETVALIENCSALLMANTPPKLQDPGSFSIPCKIGFELIQRAFCDLGASVSLLPYSLCKKLGLQNIKLTTMVLQLADHSYRYPMRIVEDVLVEVGGCIVPTDLIILDMEEDPKIPIILGRPFLATAGAIIDVKNHRLSLKIGKEKIEFDLSDSSICNPSSQDNSSKISIHKVEECNFHEIEDQVGEVMGDQKTTQKCYVEIVRTEANAAQKMQRMEVNAIQERPPVLIYEEKQEI
ncbi:uncharacterized protein LOC122033888 [Zingiber officinale]|uniref:uncharacterized protein LOC122033888 n=1 Tax=Zingiber officinale TaxID=94328 RepID=UPI001C4DD3B2|nr:uncharacterized protein LOC122033888 [Zingiber officinale]